MAAYLPLAVPAVTMGIGLITIWNQPLMDIVYGSSLIIIFGYVARFIPFAVAAAISGLRQLDTKLEEAAFMASSNWWRVMGKIVVPLISPSLITGFFIVFILALGELGTTLLVTPPGRETISLKIYNLMHYGAEEKVAALCLVLMAAILMFSTVFLILHRKLEKRTQS